MQDAFMLATMKNAARGDGASPVLDPGSGMLIRW